MKDNISLWRRIRYWWYRKQHVHVQFVVVDTNVADITFAGPGMMKLDIYTRTGQITTLPYVLTGDVVRLTFDNRNVGKSFVYKSDWTSDQEQEPKFALKEQKNA